MIKEHEKVEIFHGLVVRREQWRIGDQIFDLTWPADMDVLLDAPETHRRFNADGYMPYWAQPWPSCVLMAEAILSGKPGSGRKAIEIGCGIGLASMTAARMGWQVTATDYDEDALAFVALNAERNGIKLAGIERLDYRMPLVSPRYDCIMGADILYERRNCEPVARWIASGLLDNGYALLSDPGRSAADLFVECAPAAGLCTELRNVESIAPAGLLHRGRIWRVWKNKG